MTSSKNENPIRKRRKIVAHPGGPDWFGCLVRPASWYAICPDCGEAVEDPRSSSDMPSTRKRAKDALYRHRRTHRPSLVETANPRNA